jgi:WD40 repeat protein
MASVQLPSLGVPPQQQQLPPPHPLPAVVVSGGVPISSGHDDYIHDIAYDYYGTRIATAASDHRIKIWAQTPSQGSSSGGGGGGAASLLSPEATWTCQAAWKAHYGPVWRVAWAHPEFGQILASCSFDHTVHIWEEQEAVDDAGKVVSRWHQRAQLGDARASVNDVAFAPRHLGLKLVSECAVLFGCGRTGKTSFPCMCRVVALHLCDELQTFAFTWWRGGAARPR